MSSNIRNNRDKRWTAKTYRQPIKGNVSGRSTTYDREFTAKESDTVGNTGEPSNTDHKVDAINELVQEQLVPRIKSMSANAVTVDRRDFYYYKRKRTGRRCSCYATDTSPDNQCQICYGKGIVGGFEKYGTVV